ncbi:alpha/beta-hydrolase [Basidiobolus meristosporus CBS 931.73]|uniref:Alpha/beta-hydrolase n=1 Tax=Basidiobolus meristosporus CBS 931.73 TaxID=1314790 RepID=A0A1Y1ZA16_9FUNG|nr:alpha/beta-hydrolase [Basidiobolus meristosporus CBS 931.73]|eukprot:ORY06954.1 alpha/beta-hydrolase [Basidiobolus meristosporus CBS 931.73]
MTSWESIRQEIRAFRSSIPQPSLSTMKDFIFDDTNDCVYFIGTDPSKNFRTTTLFTVALPLGSVAYSYFDEQTVPCEHACSDDPFSSTLEWKHMLADLYLRDKLHENLSREEILAKERRRISIEGITWYLYEESSGLLVFPHSNNFYIGSVGKNKKFQPTPMFQHRSHSPRMDPKIGGRDRDLIAYVKQRDIWVSTLDGQEVQLTFCGNSDDSSISCGSPEFVMQEEFDRFTGFFWAPSNGVPSTDAFERILYLQVSESNVDQVCFAHGTKTEEFRYPRTGTPNAMSDIQIVEFAHPNEVSEQDITHKRLWGKATLNEMFPWMEYIVRLGWLPHGKSIWVQILDRRQQHMAVVKIPLSNFTTVYGYNSNVKYEQCVKDVEILYEEEIKTGWINHTIAYHFLETSNENTTEFIWSSERTGFRHLYYIKKHRLDIHWTIRPLTHGEWPVVDLPISVDLRRKAVYFIAKRDTPLENHLYVASFREDASPHHVVLLTPKGYFHNVTMNSNCTRFVTFYSSINESPKSSIYYLTWEDKSPFPKSNLWSKIRPLGITKDNLPIGNFFSFTNRNAEPFVYVFLGNQIHGCYYKPDNYVEGHKYPTLLHVYGGPKGQVVTNDYKCPRFLRMFLATKMGFVVIMIDGRGSSERGLAFETQIRWRMGTVELDDQVDGLRHLIENSPSHISTMIDTDKIAISGWSYGGYLSLLALAHYPDIFKIAIAGAPVTDWMLYDTAYTERYMGMPEENPDGYRNASVLSHVDKFPDSEHRLLLAHGLIDENVHFTHVELLVSALTKNNKPHQLQLYPNERHGIRHPATNEHFETLMFYWLKNYL